MPIGTRNKLRNKPNIQDEDTAVERELHAKVRKWLKDRKTNKYATCEGHLMTPESYRAHTYLWAWAPFITSGDKGALRGHSSYHKRASHIRQTICMLALQICFSIGCKRSRWGIGKCLVLVRWFPSVSKGFRISFSHVNMKNIIRCF